MICVAGATGHLGREICRRLAARGRAVRGLVRATSDPPTVDALRRWGVELAEADLRQPSSLPAAVRGAGAVVTTVTAMRSRQPGDGLEATDLEGQTNLVAAAREAGAAGFVYLSFSGNIGRDDPLTRAKRSLERAVQGSGMRYLVLRPSFFMETWLGPALGFDYPRRRATIYGTGERPISWVSLADVAELAVRWLERGELEDDTVELGGPERLSPAQVVREFEEEAGEPFAVAHVTEDELRRRREQSDEPLARATIALLLSYAAGDVVPMEETLRRYPLRLTGVRDYARRVLGSSPAAE